MSDGLLRRFRLPTRLIALWLPAVMGWPTFSWGKAPLARATNPGSTPFSLVTRGCGSLAELNDRVAQRSSQIRLVHPSGRAPNLEAEIKSLGTDRTEIVLTVVKKSGERLSRRVRGQTCDEALDALALLTVLTLDPAAAATKRQEPRTAPSAADLSARPVAKTSKRTAAMARSTTTSSDRNDTSTVPTAPTVPTVPTVPGEVTGTAAPRKTPVEKNTSSDSTTLESPDPGATTAQRGAIPKADEPAEIAVRSIPPPETQNDARRPGRYVLAVGASGMVMGGPAPRSLAGVSITGLWGWDRDSPWSPAITIAVAHSERNGLVFAGGTANFSVDAVQLEVCPVWVGMRRRFGARACALGMAGMLAAKGAQTLDPQAHRRFLALFGGSLAVIYQPGWRVEVVASGGVGVPLQRYAFQFETVFYRMEPISVMGGLGVALRFH